MFIKINKYKNFILNNIIKFLYHKPKKIWYHIFESTYLKYKLKNLIINNKLYNKINYTKVPYRHLATIYVIKSLERIFDYKIKFILMDGLCLGVLRNKTFAGRPKDVDLAVTENDFQKIIKNFKKIEIFFDLKRKFNNNNIPSKILKFNKKNNLTRTVRKIYSNFKNSERKFSYFLAHDNLYFYFNHILVEIKCIEKKKNSNLTVEYNFHNFHYRYNDIKNSIKVRAYSNIEFYIPKNANKYMKLRYGKSFKTPISKQFKY